MSRAATARAAWLWLLWIVLAGAHPVELAVGLPTAAVAGWVSVRLLPPGPWRPVPGLLAVASLRFLYQSVVAGFSVARQAVAPSFTPRPGLAEFPTRLPPGIGRAWFCTLASLLPGALPIGSDERANAVAVHVFDTARPALPALAAEEAAFTRCFGIGRGDG